MINDDTIGIIILVLAWGIAYFLKRSGKEKEALETEDEPVRVPPPVNEPVAAVATKKIRKQKVSKPAATVVVEKRRPRSKKQQMVVNYEILHRGRLFGRLDRGESSHFEL